MMNQYMASMMRGKMPGMQQMGMPQSGMQQMGMSQPGMPQMGAQQQPPAYASAAMSPYATTSTAATASSAGNPWGDFAAGVIPGVGSILSGMNSQNPADAAMEYSSQLAAKTQPYLQPYMDAGLGALGMLYDEYGNLISNPQSIYDMLASGFEESPGYEYNYNSAMNASNNANAAGGSLGSSAHQEQSSNLASDLAAQEWNNYMNQMFHLYGTGLEGMSGINQMGYGASNQMAKYMAQEVMLSAYLAALSAQHSNESSGGIIGGTVDAVSSIF